MPEFGEPKYEGPLEPTPPSEPIILANVNSPFFGISKPSTLEINVDEERTTFKLAGEVDKECSEFLKRYVERFYDYGQPGATLVLNASDVVFIDSKGIEVVVEALAMGQDKEIDFIIQNPSLDITRILEMANLDTHFRFEWVGSEDSQSDG